jgi:hypothetical protein
MRHSEEEWHGCLFVKTSDGRIVNVAEELNRLEKEKKTKERYELEDQIIRDLILSSPCSDEVLKNTPDCGISYE